MNLKQIRPEQIFIKPNFTDSDAITISTSVKDQFIFAGRLEKTKGIRLLLKAWKQFEMNDELNFLIICGTGNEEQWCKNYIQENNLKRIKMLGNVPNHQVKMIMAESKGMILPTQLYEGFPMSIVEAYSVGCPVLCSDFGNAGMLVEEGITGNKFKPDSYIDIVRALIAQNQKPLDRDRIKKVYMEKYSKEVNYSILQNIYSQVTHTQNK